MKKFYRLRINLLILINLCAFIKAYNQVPTYTIDETFDTQEIFMAASSVSDFYLLSDGRILVGGTFHSNQVDGFGMIYSNGQLDNDWGGNDYYGTLEIIAQEDGYVYYSIVYYGKMFLDGTLWSDIHQDYWSEYLSGSTFSPYTVKRVWDIYQMENGDLLLGGAIANDTLLPNTFRGISRIHADGSHDPTFPVLNITPNNAGGAVRDIYKAPDGSWYISGSFTAINEHETNHVAKLTPEFEVDTTFVSPFMYDGPVNYTEDIILVDNQSRVWVSGYRMRLQENPNDTIQIIRLSSDGAVDESFLPRKLENNYPDGWQYRPSLAYKAREIQNHPGNFFIYGSFSHFNDTIQPCITVVNDTGIIQSHFLQNQGATINLLVENEPRMPRIDVVKQRPDGSIFIGGAFSEFMGETRYSVVKLKPDSITSTPSEIERASFKVYPNPARANVTITFENKRSGLVDIIALSGKVLETRQMLNGRLILDISGYPKGMYFLRVALEDRVVTGKLVVN